MAVLCAGVRSVLTEKNEDIAVVRTSVSPWCGGGVRGAGVLSPVLFTTSEGVTRMAANAASIVAVLHKVIDGLGAGHDHLHDELEQGKYEPAQPAPSADEIAAAQALLARANPAPADEAEV